MLQYSLSCLYFMTKSSELFVVSRPDLSSRIIPLESLRPRFSTVITAIKQAVAFSRKNPEELIPCACCKTLIQPFNENGTLCVSLDFAKAFLENNRPLFAGALAYWHSKNFSYAAFAHKGKQDNHHYFFFQQALGGLLQLAEFGSEATGWFTNTNLGILKNIQITSTSSSHSMAFCLDEATVSNILTDQNIAQLNNLPVAIQSAFR